MAWCLGPALRKGFSSLPPPATSPIEALHLSSIWMLLPDGSLMMTSCPALEKSVAEAPPDRTSFPPSPGLSSMLDILVPSGMLPTGSMFPVVEAAGAVHDAERADQILAAERAEIRFGRRGGEHTITSSLTMHPALPRAAS